MNRKRKTVAVYPGSFDPMTNGHLDIIGRGLSVFDDVIIAILVNPEKSPLFTVEERVAIIREAYRGNRRVHADTFSGLLVDYAVKVDASVIVRGLRAISDFEFEFQMALMNRRLNPRIETVFMMPAEKYSYLSSRLVKEVFHLGGNVEGLVPPVVLRRLQDKYRAGPTAHGGERGGIQPRVSQRGRLGGRTTATVAPGQSSERRGIHPRVSERGGTEGGGAAPPRLGASRRRVL